MIYQINETSRIILDNNSEHYRNSRYMLQRRGSFKLLWKTFYCWHNVAYISKCHADDYYLTPANLIVKLHEKEIENIRRTYPNWEWKDRIAQVAKFYIEEKSN